MDRNNIASQQRRVCPENEQIPFNSIHVNMHLVTTGALVLRVISKTRVYEATTLILNISTNMLLRIPELTHDNYQIHSKKQTEDMPLTLLKLT